MANYAVTTWQQVGQVIDLVTAMKTKLETIDTGKTIRSIGIIPRGNTATAWIIYDT
jgi:hypothetical protein